MKLSTLAGKEQELDIRVGDGPEDVVHVVYQPGNLTLEFADKIRELQAEGFDMEIALELLTRTLVSWDLENEDGSPLGVEPEAIKKIPIAFLGQLMGAMEAEARPNRSRDGTSDEPSSLAPVTSLHGTSSAEQPDSGESPRGSLLTDPSPG